MTFRSQFHCPSTPLLPLRLLLLSFLLATASANKYLPPSVILEQKNDAQQVLLIQVTASAPAGVLQSECGTDALYTTSAIVLGVNRTVDPTETALGAQTEGRVMERCVSALEFRTFERTWIPGCEAYADPGRKADGTCGYAYLTPGMEASDPYALAVTGAGGFEEVDGSVCRREAELLCPEHVYVPKDDVPKDGGGDEDEGGKEPASGSGDKSDSVNLGDSGNGAGDGTGGAGKGEEGEGEESILNGTVQSYLGRPILIGLLSMLACWRICV